MPAAENEITGERIEAALASAGDARPDLERLGGLIAARAEAEGLVDVAYAETDSPIGTLLVAVTDRGLVQVGWQDSDHEALLDRLAATVGPRVLELPARLDRVRRELDEYFAGRRRSFDLALDWRLTDGFTRKVLTETAAIPFGETRTYAELAAAVGSPRAFRAAGSALGANPIPIVVPCHRVLRTGGGIGGYGGGLESKRALLEIEGVPAGA